MVYKKLCGTCRKKGTVDTENKKLSDFYFSGGKYAASNCKHCANKIRLARYHSRMTEPHAKSNTHYIPRALNDDWVIEMFFCRDAV